MLPFEIGLNKKCRKRELLSLLGTMNFACKAVPAGCFFMQRFIDLSTKARMPQHFLTLNQQARLDLAWWNSFLPTWNGHSFFLDSEWSSSPDMNLFTDASLTSYSGLYGGAWLLGKWVGAQLNHPIAWKELALIIIASLTWGDQWKGKRVLFQCDNQTIVFMAKQQFLFPNHDGSFTAVVPDSGKGQLCYQTVSCSRHR